MNIIDVKGDLFSYIEDASPRTPRFIGHGVNMQGSMGAGIALEFAKRWPLLESVYASKCRLRQVYGGMADLNFVKDNVGVFNLFTQKRPGPDAKTRWVSTAVHNAADILKMYQYKPELAVPRLGCGIGGLDWDDDVRPALEKIDVEFDLYVYYL